MRSAWKQVKSAGSRPASRSRLARLWHGWCCAVGLGLAAASPAPAQTAADLQLVLAVDASGSVDTYRFELQRRGYIQAFRNPRVLQAVRGGASQSIAVTMMQWTGPLLHRMVVPWTQLKDEASVETVASLIERTPRQLFGGGT